MEASRPAQTSRAFTGLVAAALLTGGLGYWLALRYVTGPPVDKPRSLAFLSRVAASVNPLFPRRVDANTEITRVSALEGVFIYHYRFVNAAASGLDQAVFSRLRPTVTRAACGSELTLNAFIRQDVTLRYTYSNEAGRVLASFDVTRADCGV